MFPERMRRLRSSERIRRMVTETRLHPDNLMLPVFFSASLISPETSDSMPGVITHPLSDASAVSRELDDKGVNSVMLFGIPNNKDKYGSQAFAENGPAQTAIRKMKSASDIIVTADMCLCGYTDHGHCGLVVNGEVDNDRTLEQYAKMAISLAEAGADVIAPSGMMDHQVSAIRDALDISGFKNIPIMAYSAKFFSSFYGPFRDVAHSAPSDGDRSTYQMQYGNKKEALREIELDIREGADIVMVKPAMPYLDIIRDAKDLFSVPIAAYQVSGEYSMIKAAAGNGWIDEQKAMIESLTSIKRAGADIIISYFTENAVKEMRRSDG